MNGIASGYTPSKGKLLDKLRHNDPKLRRRLHQQGRRIGRAEQYAIVVAEGRMASVVTAQGVEKGATGDAQRNFLVRISEETFDRVDRLRKNKRDNNGFFLQLLDAYELSESGGPQVKLPDATLKRLRLLASVDQKSLADFVGALCDHWEKPRPTAVANGNVTAEALALLTQWQAKLGLRTQLDTVRRLCELADAADKRATRLIAVEQDLAATRKTVEAREAEIATIVAERESALADLAAAKERLVAKMQAQPVNPVVAAVLAPSTDEVQNVLFDFVQTFTGSTATADTSGEIVVSTPPEKMAALFAIWGRAVRCLGIAKRAS